MIRLTPAQRQRLKDSVKHLRPATSGAENVYGNPNPLREQIEHEIRLENARAFHHEGTLRGRVFHHEPSLGQTIVPRAGHIRSHAEGIKK